MVSSRDWMKTTQIVGISIVILALISTLSTNTSSLVGHAAVADTDGDGVMDKEFRYVCSHGWTSQCNDNCLLVPNPDQADHDYDGIGTACEEDSDRDGVPDSAYGHRGRCGWKFTSDCDDNCPHIVNPDQADGDRNGVGDVCESNILAPVGDIDNDGVPNEEDRCPRERGPAANNGCPKIAVPSKQKAGRSFT